ncbi:DUF927 domain-containing protein [Pseudophaeobacter flagellatus]|uniref:DUF927 domain-containing protein n=1 Tax=Pseudophaeobacter flagellatus TaxID=2899119 RepID=UPI002FCB6A91
MMILALSHAFTGPLLSVLGRDGGGFHLRGVSSRGKSMLLGVAASVWGAPSFVQSWRGTDNGIEGIAAACNDSLLVLDELHQVEPRVAGEIVYMLANGRGKTRMNSNGRSQQTLRWSVPVLSSGELSLEEHTRLAKYVERRVLELKPTKSQSQIASEAGFPNPNMVTMIKNGTSKLALDRVPSMARALRCDPAYLMRLTLEQAIGSTTAEAVIDLFGDPVTVNVRSQLAARLGVMLAAQGTHHGETGLAQFLTDMRALDRSQSEALDWMQASDRSALRRKMGVLNGRLVGPVPPPAGAPPAPWSIKRVSRM